MKVCQQEFATKNVQNQKCEVKWKLDEQINKLVCNALTR